MSKKSSCRKVVMIGAFPPPVHGMAVINEAMFNVLSNSGFHVERIDIAAPSLARGLGYHLHRILKVLRGSCRLIALRSLRGATLYMSVSGGAGQGYECVFACLAKLRGMDVVFHHHCYTYVTIVSSLARYLFRFAPRGSTHIALSEGMANRLENLYGIDNVRVISNAAFKQPGEVPARTRDAPLVLGFLSNISEEKGILDFFALMDACEAAGLEVRGQVAGPFQDAGTEALVRPMIVERESVTYLGPRYGIEKDQFFGSIDVLVFPTRYANEAEPVTIHEALMHAVPVIAFGRGAIPEMLTGGSGVVIPPHADFAACGLSVIEDWRRGGKCFSTASMAAQTRFAEMKRSADGALHEFLRVL